MPAFSRRDDFIFTSRRTRGNSIICITSEPPGSWPHAMPADSPEILTPWLGRRTAKWLTPVLLVFGVQCWLVFGGGDYGRQHQPLMILAAVVAGLIAPVSRAFDRLW